MSVNTSIDHNPLWYHPKEICEMIFQHLSGAELLMASEISPSWLDLTAESKSCTRKLQIKISENALPNIIKHLLMTSQRNYVNMCISKCSNLINDLLHILKVRYKKWKCMRLRQIDFETMDDAISFLSVLGPNLEELHMDQVYIRTHYKHWIHVGINFPKLKILEIKCCQALLFDVAFNNCCHLTTFAIKAGNMLSPEALAAILKILKININLKKLSISFNIFNSIFIEDISAFAQFQLKEFHALDLYRVPGCYATIKRNLHQFLLGQRGTIEVLSIGDWMGLDIFKLILRMPALKDVTIQGIHQCEPTIDWDNIGVHCNQSLDRLNFHDMSNSRKILKAVLTIVPNITTLEIISINQLIMDHITVALPALNNLYVERIEALSISNDHIFHNLKKFSVKKISQRTSC